METCQCYGRILLPQAKRGNLKNTTNVFLAEKFICHDVTDSVENLSDLVVQYDVVLVMKVLFKDSISSKEFFEENELTTLFFSGVADVKSLFKYHM